MTHEVPLAGKMSPIRCFLGRFAKISIPSYNSSITEASMEKHLATAELVQDYFRLFVNRRAYTVQSPRPHTRSARYYYYRPKDAASGKDLSLTYKVIARPL